MVQVFGYGRPTASQPDPDDHARALSHAGAEQVLVERGTVQARGTLRERRRLLARIAPGDVLILQGLDRLGSNFDDVLRCFELLIERGVEIRVLDAEFDSTGSDGAANRRLLGLLAGARAALKSEQIRHNLAVARIKGGRIPGKAATLSPDQWPEIRRRLETETRASLAADLGVHRQTLWAFARRMLDQEAEPAVRSGRPKSDVVKG